MERLRRRWFLILLLAGLTLGWLCPQWLRPITAWMEPRLIVAFALFIMAGTLESRSLFRSLIHPAPALWAWCIGYTIPPALAWLVGGLLPVADLRLGLLIITSVPCTPASSVLWTRLAGGNEAVALLTVLLTMATSWLITPAWLAFAARAGVALDTAGMMSGLALVLIVPVGLGQLGRAIGPVGRAAGRHQRLLGVLSRLLIFSMILKAVSDVSDRLSDRSVALSLSGILAAVALSVGVHLAALGTGFWSSRLLHFDRGSRIAVAFAGSQKTLPVSLYLFDVYFKDAYPLAIVPLVCYHVGQLIVDTGIADLFVRASNSGDKHGTWAPSEEQP